MAEVARGRQTREGDAVAPDPRALRIGLAPELRQTEDEALTVAPAAVPVRPRPDDLTALGPLGGVARLPGDDPGEGGAAARSSLQDRTVLLVNGQAVRMRLDRRDSEHAILEIDASDEPLPLGGAGVAAISGVRSPDEDEPDPGRSTDSPVTDRFRASSRRVVFGKAARRTMDGLLVQEVIVDGWRFELEIEPERRAALRERARRGHESAGHAGPLEIRAIIPGRIVAISVAVGDAVEAGQQLLVLEAMKMQNELRAPRDGEIERIAVSVGQTVEVGNLLMVIS